jgi:anti-sigma factor RsiW
MNIPHHSNDQISKDPTCNWVQDMLDAYLAGDLSTTDQERFEIHCGDCDTCTHAIEWAEMTDTVLRSLPMHTCPDPVLDAVFDHVRSQRRSVWRNRLNSLVALRGGIRWQPALALAMVLVCIITIGILMRPTVPTEPEPTEAEIAQAVVDVKWALGYVSNVSRKTGMVVREDVIEPHVITPVQRQVNALIESPQ